MAGLAGYSEMIYISGLVKDAFKFYSATQRHRLRYSVLLQICDFRLIFPGSGPVKAITK